MSLKQAKKWIKIIVVALAVSILLYALLWDWEKAKNVLLFVWLGLILAEAVLCVGFLRCPHCRGGVHFSKSMRYCPHCGKELED